MTYTIILLEDAEREIIFFAKTGNKAVLKKINDLLNELRVHPRTGTGKPKQLTGDLSGFWSRRITSEHRMIYSIEDDKVIVEIISLKGHYYDK